MFQTTNQKLIVKGRENLPYLSQSNVRVKAPHLLSSLLPRVLCHTWCRRMGLEILPRPWEATDVYTETALSVGFGPNRGDSLQGCPTKQNLLSSQFPQHKNAEQRGGRSSIAVNYINCE